MVAVTKERGKPVMKVDMDKLQFESRREIEAVMKALDEYLGKHPDDETVKELMEKLDYMHMVW